MVKRIPASPELMYESSEATRELKKGWSQSGRLITGGGGGVSLSASFTEPGPYTVQFGSDALASLGIGMRASVFWSVNGNTISRRIDVGQGSSISGVAEAVKVKLVDNSPGSVPGRTYAASITVVKGLRPNIQQPPTLNEIFGGTIVAPAGTATINVPSNAGIVSVFTTVRVVSAIANLYGDFEVRQLDSTGVFIPGLDPRPGFWWPLASHVSQLQFVNRSAVNCEFFANFGVDG